jgi:hypothetical protein
MIAVVMVVMPVVAIVTMGRGVVVGGCAHQYLS